MEKNYAEMAIFRGTNTKDELMWGIEKKYNISIIVVLYGIMQRLYWKKR